MNDKNTPVVLVATFNIRAGQGDQLTALLNGLPEQMSMVAPSIVVANKEMPVLPKVEKKVEPKAVVQPTQGRVREQAEPSIVPKPRSR